MTVLYFNNARHQTARHGIRPRLAHPDQQYLDGPLDERPVFVAALMCRRGDPIARWQGRILADF